MGTTQNEIAGAGAGAATGAAVGAAADMAAGAAVGSVAGPEGAVAGALIGALFGWFLTPHTYGSNIKGAPDPIVPWYMDYDFDTPCMTPDTIMNPVNKRSNTPVETPKPKRENRRINIFERDVKFTGPSYKADWCRDFSAIQRTRVNPVTGRIIGYKGISRKRRLSPISKYSSFWREQKYQKPSLHASRSPGIWDSARR